MSVRAVRGTRDLLPEETSRWQLIESQARLLSQQYGYLEIRTPLFEKAELFVRGMGVLAGLVERELWTFHDKFGQKLALRADVTASVVRAYYENNLNEKNQGVSKFYYLAPVFLIGRETEEGSRQSHQFGVEALGSPHPAQDAEVIALAWAFLKRIGLSDVVFELNSLGCDKCRPAYHEVLKEYFSSHSNELCGTCKRKHKTHPLWTLGCNEKSCAELGQVAPTMFGLLCPACKQHFSQLKAYLAEMKIPHDLNPRVVRDLEYYNRTIFQVRHGESVLGTGGRYDGLVETLGGPDTPAVGFALQLEAILEAVPGEFTRPSPSVYLQPEGEEATRLLMPVLNVLREAGIYAEMALGGEEAPEAPRFLVLLSEKDAIRGVAQVHDRHSDHKDRYNLSELAHRLASRLGMGGAVAPAERAPREKESRSGRGGTRRNGALRGRHFNVESDLEVHYDQQQEPATASERGDGRSKRRRRRRRGQEDDAPPVETRHVSTHEPEEERTSSRSRRRRRSRRDSEAESRTSTSERAAAYPPDDRYEESSTRRYYDDYEREDYSPRYEREDYRDEPPAYREREEYSREEAPRSGRGRDDRYRSARESSVETGAYESSGRGRRGRSSASTSGGGSGSRSGSRSAPPSYEDDYRRSEPAPRYHDEDYYDEPRGRRTRDDDDEPAPVDSKLALLESSRAAASRYRASDGDSDSSRRRRRSSGSGGSGGSGGGGQRSASSSSGGGRRRRSSSSSRRS
ncbi:MAG: hypothetical protein AMXMBFR33_14890 [Candidatus Xenobia bacterium]